jgi:hypothetical protein
MALKKNHQGVEGYFYRCGNKKLAAQPAVIERGIYGALEIEFKDCGRINDFGLHLHIKKNNYTYTSFFC